MEPSELREFLSGPPVTMEIHDRDRIPEKQKLKAALFGDDLQDEKISNVGTVTSKSLLRLKWIQNLGIQVQSAIVKLRSVASRD